MSDSRIVTVLCLASYFKGGSFIRACKNLGCKVILLTKEKLVDEAWPWEAIDERFLMPDITKKPDIIYSVSYLARSRKIDLIVALDDFDVETAAALREHLRIPGMGDTTARYFRDKLAMRVQAQEKGISVPEFTGVINYEDISSYMRHVQPPWVLKPRSQAGAMGIKKVHSESELWRILDELGDRQSFFVLERFIPGDIYHVDTIVSEKRILFAEAHQYRQPPLAVTQEGGIFMSRTLPRNLDEVTQLKEMNKELMQALGMVRGIAHTEFIRGEEDGRLYFLETAARVAGANIAEMIEFATGINLWEEWAKIELARVCSNDYQLPEMRLNYAGVLICLARQEYPDLSGYADLEVSWHLHKKHHAGVIVASSDQGRIERLLDDYSQRFFYDFLAVAPPLDEAPL
ncbi:MAG TPA: ATP-grasp domain-containing protein [Patescibacteria group bacterium]|nr:ATP-grasp domain-containing protein [Patescibacteria group bacterium]